MVIELQKALIQIELLPTSKQKRLGKLLLDELSWDNSFAYSKEKLETLAQEALVEFKKGKTRKADW